MNSDFSKLSKEERELRFTALALGELAPAEADEIQQAIAADAELAREFERLKQTVELVRETSAMDRKVSNDGTPLRLDEARRKKLLETFQTPVPAPEAVKPRRRRNLWFVPMSAAAVLVGLLVVSVTELGNIGPWRKSRARQATSVGLWDGGGKPYVTGSYFSDLGKDSKRRPIVLRYAHVLPDGGSPGTPAAEFATRDFDADGSVTYAIQKRVDSQPADPGAKTALAGTIALPTVTARGEDAWLDLNRNAAGVNDFATVASSTPAVAPVVINEVMYNPPSIPPTLVQAGDTASSTTVRTTFAENNSPVTGGFHFAGDNVGQTVNLPATAPVPLEKETKERFDAGPRTVKGMAWPGQDSQNRSFQIQRNSLAEPAVVGGRQIAVAVKDNDLSVRSANLAQLYEGMEVKDGIAAGKVAEPTPSPGKPQEQGMNVYSADAAGYANLALKPEYKLIDGLDKNSGSVQLWNSYSASAGAGPKPSAPSMPGVTVNDPNRGDATKLAQDGKLFYESGNLKEAEEALRQATKIDPENKSAAYYGDLVAARKSATEARMREIGSKQLLTEVEQAWSSPVARSGLPQPGSEPSLGFGVGGGGGATDTQGSIGGGGIGGERRSGGRANRSVGAGGFVAQVPESEVRAAITSVESAGEVVAAVPQRFDIDARFMDVGQNSQALGLDSPLGNKALNDQSVARSGKTTGANAADNYRFRILGSDVGAPIVADDGAVVYQNGAEVARTNALVSNQNWGMAGNTVAINDSTWFAKDEREKSLAGSYGISAGSAPSVNQWRANGEKPASVDYVFSASGSMVPADQLITVTNRMVSSSLSLVVNNSDGFGEFPATAGDKQFPANVTERSFGQSQSRSGGQRDERGVNLSDSRNLYRSGVAVAPGQPAGGAGGAVPKARGFYDDNVNTAPTKEWERASSDLFGRVDIQLPTPANEPSVNRQSGLEQSLGEKPTVDYSGRDTFTKETLLGVDVAGVPIADLEAKEDKKINLNYGGVAAGDKLEGNLQTAAVETGKPASRSEKQIQVHFANPSGERFATNSAVAAQVAVRGIPADERRLAAPRSFASTNGMIAGQEFVLTNAAGISGNFKPDVAAPGTLVAGTAFKESGVNPAPAKPSVPAPTPQPEVLTRENAFSTFSLNVSDVSFKLAAASLEKGALPEVANVRSEEFINAFDYRDPMPVQGAPIAFTSERARYPFAHNRDVVRFSVKTAAQGREAGKPLNIVLLLDNSGSMERADRVRIIQESLRSLAAQLKPQDKLSVVTFSRTARLAVDGVTGAQAAEVANKIGALTPEGGTNLEDALDLAYKTALRHYTATAVNRVVLLTDGAANLGNVEPKELKAKVEGFRKQGIALDCFGIGWEGFNDDLLEQLSRNGDGRYGFVNTPEEAASEFVGQLAGALRVAASDVKMQVEFNPKRVTAWRQIGYAKHQLTKQQFRDNKVDAAEIGAAESGNALYVIETNPSGEGPIATVRARFRVPQTSDYREHEWVVPFGSAVELEQSSPSLRLATSASAFSEWLASSPFAGDVSTDRLLKVVSGVPETYGADPRPKKLEWMIRQAKSISGK